MALNFVAMAIAARLLTPAEFGVSVLGGGILAIAVAIREFAPRTYLIQRHELSTDDVRTALTLVMLISLPLFLGVALGAEAIEGLYDVPGVAGFLLLIACILLVEPIWQTIVALLQREMAFGKVAITNACKVATEAGVLVGCAYFGLGYLSFAIAWLAGAVIALCTVLLLRPDFGIFRPRLSGWREVARFGGYAGGAAVLHQLYQTVPFLVFTRTMPLFAVGLLNRTVSIVELPDKTFLAGVVSVVMPAYAELARRGEDLKSAYLRAIENITAVQWPALVMVAVLAHPIVGLLLGDQWTAAVPLIQIIALGRLFSFTAQLNYPVLVVTGAIRENLIRAAIIWPISAVILITAGFFGPTAVALAFFVVVPFQAVVTINAVRRRIDLGVSEIIGTLPKSAGATLAAAAPAAIWATAQGWDWEFNAVEAIVLGASAAPCWLFTLWALRHPMWPELVSAAARVTRNEAMRRIVLRR